ncbi:SoxR reducing system RseC family protein [bacterium]|nr:SoxR reducing system RseC family protein [bacterium]
MREVIEHFGVVENIIDDKIIVSVITKSACASCHAKGACSIADLKEKVIEAKATNGEIFNKGDKVIVQMEQKLGFLALFLGYLLPFIVVITALLISSAIFTELIAAVVSLLFLVIYYLSLYFLRKRWKNTFQFIIRKAGDENISHPL